MNHSSDFGLGPGGRCGLPGLAAFIRTGLVGLCALLLSGCITMVTTFTSGFAEDLGDAILDNPDVEMVQEGAPAYLLLMDALVANSPDNPDLLYDRALYAVELGRIDILEQDLSKVIQNDPNHADALNALGYTLADQTTRYGEALMYIERALALKPDSAAILDSMGWVQYRLGNNLEALRYLRRALELQPDAEIAAHLGEVLWVTGDREEARKVWQAALADNPDDELLQRLMEHGPTAVD